MNKNGRYHLRLNEIWTMLVLVAVLGVTIVIVKRAVESKKDLELAAQSYAADAERFATFAEISAIEAEAAEDKLKKSHKDRVVYFEQLTQKYLRASKEPWKPVPPDPPEPPKLSRITSLSH